MAPIKIKVVNSRKEKKELTVDSDATVEQLKKEYSARIRKLDPNRQRWTMSKGAGERPVVLNHGPLSNFNVSEGSELNIKDLGPQISWRGVFIIEYLGPMLIFPLLYLQPSFIFGSHTPLDQRPLFQNIALICWVFHFFKREYETIFIHRFSSETMPLRNLFKNSGYYWGFAAWTAYFVSHPLFTAPPELYSWIGLAIFIVSELMNFHAHLILRNLRKPGTRERNIPHGQMFELVSCANYFWEILAWVGFTIMTSTVSAGVFALVGALQMSQWALGKHRNYRKEFPNYPKSRKALFPFIL